ncbi:hypothetical protein [Aquimarina litoralis]|uniref:hypothetical protein n=1 Tax=Aquimarina litoralis TaxID=584605 RepID=UPI001C569D4F|nr:hypothetical protein [Aquimarina litoralis]MBW1297856.1 hypothetical protein [Aquimarina litoralis]
MKKTLPLFVFIICILSCKNNEKKEYDDEKNSSTPDQEIKNESNTANTTTSLSSLDLAMEVDNFIICKKTATKRNDCRNSITKTITKAFDLTEFSDPKLGYVIYDSIRPIAERSKNWLQLGTINQESIDQALAHTNRGGLSLIIDTAETYGHVVMIVPGDTKKSGSWDMKLPNVLSLSNYKPEKSFSNKSLSYAMKKSDDLKIYVRQ